MTAVKGKLRGDGGSADCLVRKDADGAGYVVPGSVNPSLPIGDYDLTVGNIPPYRVRFDGADWKNRDSR